MSDVESDILIELQARYSISGSVSVERVVQRCVCVIMPVVDRHIEYTLCVYVCMFVCVRVHMPMCVCVTKILSCP